MLKFHINNVQKTLNGTQIFFLFAKCNFLFFLLTGVKYDLALLKRFSGYLNKRSSHTASSRVFRRMLDHALPVCPLTSSLQLHYSKNGNHCLGQRVEFPSPAQRLGVPYWFITERWLLDVGSCFLLYLGQWSDSLASFFF